MRSLRRVSSGLSASSLYCCGSASREAILCSAVAMHTPSKSEAELRTNASTSCMRHPTVSDLSLLGTTSNSKQQMQVKCTSHAEMLGNTHLGSVHVRLCTCKDHQRCLCLGRFEDLQGKCITHIQNALHCPCCNGRDRLKSRPPAVQGSLPNSAQKAQQHTVIQHRSAG